MCSTMIRTIFALGPVPALAFAFIRKTREKWQSLITATGTVTIPPKTQFEIECRSCGQSIVNFMFNRPGVAGAVLQTAS